MELLEVFADMILDRQLGKPLIIWYSMEGYTNKNEKKKKIYIVL